MDFEGFKLFVTKKFDFDCSKYTDSFLNRRIGVRMRVNNLENFDDYSKLLLSEELEWSKLHKEFLIHTTNFFRDEKIWGVLISEVIPLMIELRENKLLKKIKIWSAGSSTGEEPVSIAIAMKEALGSKFSDYDVQIIATDRDEPTIERARQAYYEEMQFKETPEKFMKYFEKVDEEYYRPIEEIRKLIEYKVGDILSFSKEKYVDLLFCRNTVIYFNKPTKERLYKEFYDCLNQNGFFIMGMTETLVGEAKELFQAYDHIARIFVKKA